MTIDNQVVVTGFVLYSSSYKENDVLLQVYTFEYGKITIHARGVKKVSSKNRAACQLMTKSEFTIILRKGICTLIKAEGIDFFSNIKKDIIIESYGSFIIEAMYKLTTENLPSENIYNVLDVALFSLNEGKSGWLVYVLFIVELLKLNGTELIYDCCSNCNNRSVVGISIKSGGFICDSCIGSFDKAYDVTFLHIFRLINASGLKHLDKLDVSVLIEYEEDLVLLMEMFFDEFVAMYSNSRKFIQQFREYR